MISVIGSLLKVMVRLMEASGALDDKVINVVGNEVWLLNTAFDTGGNGGWRG